MSDSKARRDAERAKTARRLSRRYAGKAANVRRYGDDDDLAGIFQNKANRYATLAARLEQDAAEDDRQTA